MKFPFNWTRSVTERSAGGWLAIGLCCPLLALGQSQPINEGLDGAWLNPNTQGQGVLIDVNATTGFVFLAWFTYAPGAQAGAGDEAHRWYTAQGNYSGDSATLVLSATSGGAFNAPSATTTTSVGSVTVQFNTCTEAQFSYTFDDGSASGQFPLSRLAPDVLCADLTPASTVKLTYIGNDGVFVSNGDEGVLIDAIGNFNGWINTPLTLRTSLQNAQAPYDQALFVVATHNHGDHLVSTQVNTYLGNNPRAQVVVVPSARGNFAADRRTDLSPQRFAAASTTSGGITLTVINTRHFNQFGTDFSTIDNYTYVIDIDGRRVVHMGDIDYADDNFQAIVDGGGDSPDVIVMPTFNTLISADNFNRVRQFFPQAQLIGAHFRSGSLADETSRLLALEPNAVIFDQPLEEYTIE